MKEVTSPFQNGQYFNYPDKLLISDDSRVKNVDTFSIEMNFLYSLKNRFFSIFEATFNDVVDFRDCTALNAGRLLCMSVAYTEEGGGITGVTVGCCGFFYCSKIHGTVFSP